ncbi:SET domain-containing protein [Glonium stellatum]|uniref:SET domain-containing protein n=1 Tax=Glonium stellatum TaxID=574774 RepID=A0A8E2EUJ6_9PEZI|nr:SET domain-containing protein [Glonium stellatum]
MPPLVVILRTERGVRVENVEKILSNRINNVGEEQYLVRWRTQTKTQRPPLSWHGLSELSRCLELVQDYLEVKLYSSSCRKRKSPDDDDNHDAERISPAERRLKRESRASSTVSSSSNSSLSPSLHHMPHNEFPEIKIYNGVFDEINGYIVARCASTPDMDHVNIHDVPTAQMLAIARRSSTRQAEELIRAEIIRRLRLLSGPKVHLINTYDSSSPCLRFQFITEYVLREGVIKLDPATTVGCQKCSPHMGRDIGCEYTKKCDCLEYAAVDENRLTAEEKELYKYIKKHGGDTTGLPKKFPYYAEGTKRAKTGCLVPFYLKSRNPIYECNDNCKCGRDCRNKNVQFGRRMELEIFKTKSRGWGLRCRKDLREGEFVDTYRGEVITDKEATRREESGGKSKASYLYSLDKFAETEGIPQEEIYVVDGEFMGGPTKFMNHSCEPNCRQYTVSYNKHDAKIYDIAFFACRDIPAMEELTFDYLDKDEEDEDGDEQSESQPGEDAVPCLCGAKKCRKWLWT